MSNNYVPQPDDRQQRVVQPVIIQPGAQSGSQNSVYVPVMQYQKKESEFRKKLKETIGSMFLPLLAVAAFVFGMLESRLIINGGFGFGVTIVTAAWYLLFTPFILRKGKKIPFAAFLTAIPMLVLAASFSFSGSGSGRLLMVLALMVMFWLNTAMLSGCADGRLALSTVGQTARAHGDRPFDSLGTAISSLFKGGEKKKSSDLVKVLLGVLISLPVVIILLVSFSCADSVFADTVKRLLSMIKFVDLSDIIVDIILGVILSVYFFPLAIVLRTGYREESSEKEHKGFLDCITSATVLFISSLVYILFCVVQFKYLFAVQLGYYFNYTYDRSLTLPGDMTWAEYGRSGFFELSAIIIFTFIICTLVITYAKRDENGRIPAFLKAALTVISCCNMILVCSAVLRMRLYTIWCGLTAKRVGVLMMITFIFICLIFLIIKIWQKRFKLFTACTALAMVFVTVFGCMNVDALCARVNVSRYLDEGTTIDIGYLSELSESAAPYVERLINEADDNNIKNCARGIITKYHFYGYDYLGNGYENLGFGAKNLDKIYAEKLYQKYRNGKETIDFLDEYINYENVKRAYEKDHGEDDPDNPYRTFEDYLNADKRYYPYEDYDW